MISFSVSLKIHNRKIHFDKLYRWASKSEAELCLAMSLKFPDFEAGRAYEFGADKDPYLKFPPTIRVVFMEGENELTGCTWKKADCANQSPRIPHSADG